MSATHFKGRGGIFSDSIITNVFLIQTKLRRTKQSVPVFGATLQAVFKFNKQTDRRQESNLVHFSLKIDLVAII